MTSVVTKFKNAGRGMDIHLSQIALYLSGARYHDVDFEAHTHEVTGPTRTMDVPGSYGDAKRNVLLAVTDPQTRAEVRDIIDHSYSLIARCCPKQDANQIMILEGRAASAQQLLDGYVQQSIVKQLPFLSDVTFVGPLDFPFWPEDANEACASLLETTEKLMAMNGGRAWVQLRIDHNIGNQVLEDLRNMNFLSLDADPVVVKPFTSALKR